MKYILFALLAFAGNAMAQTPQAACGKIVHIEKFQTTLVEPRNVDIWLPEGYDSGKKYAVGTGNFKSSNFTLR